MGFVIGKLVWTFVQPLSSAFILLVAGLGLGWLGMRKIRSLFLLLSALLLFVTLYTTAGPAALASLENRIVRPADPTGLTCMIVLGGAIDTPVTAARGGFEMAQAADRFTEALRLARLNPEARIVVSGGDGSFSGTYEGDAAVSDRFFAAFGIDPARLVKETDSRSTSENVALTGPLLAREGLADCLVITSAFHMPRTLGLLARQGISVRPWPVDYRTTGDTTLAFDFTQPSLNAQLATTAAREWAALAMAYLGGQTLHLVPAGAADGRQETDP